jgi:ethanolamine utilization protein EutN
MPLFAKVIGTIWGTRKYTGLDGTKMQLIQPISARGEMAGDAIAAVDTIGAGQGETVLYITAYEAVIPCRRGMIPVDAAIIGIVDSVHVREIL